MSITITDKAAVAAMAGATGPQDVRGPDGRILGRFVPAPRPGMMFPEIGIPDEELFARLDDPNATWHTADEVMARLRELG